MEILGTAINPVAIGLCAIVAFVIGFVWYGILFREPWVAAQGWTEEKIKSMQSSSDKIGMITPMVASFIGYLITAIALSVVLRSMEINDYSNALSIAFLLWLAFPAAIGLMHTLYGMRSLTGYLIDATYELVYILTMAEILIWMA